MSDCSTHAFDVPKCPKCGGPMEPVVMGLDSAMLPDGYRWVRYACPRCREKGGRGES